MELTPQLLTDEIDFRIAVRGYDRHEVDDFLERVAVAVGQLQTQLAKAVARARSAETRVAELEDGTAVPAAVEPVASAGEIDDRVEEPEGPDTSAPSAPGAQAPVAKAPPSAPVPVIGDDAALNEELRRTLVLAQRTADTAIREAHDEAREILEAANEEARRNREAAEAAHAAAREEARGRLLAEIRALEATREDMRADTVVLDRYLGTERARVRETIQVLRRLVDEPGSFRAAPVPELSQATVPTESGDVGADIVESSEVEPSEVESEEVRADDVRAEEIPAGRATAPVASTAAGPAGDSDGEEVSGGQAHGSQVSEHADEPIESPEGTLDDGEVAAPEEQPTGARSSEERPAVDDGQDDPEVDPGTDEEAGQSDSERLGQLFAPGNSAKDWRSGGSERGDQGPHTQPVAAARFEEESDEAFLAELRRAMSDDEPLGPSDT